jgi:hypothetical protein
MRRLTFALVVVVAIALACRDTGGPASGSPRAHVNFVLQDSTYKPLFAARDSFWAKVGIDRQLRLFLPGHHPRGHGSGVPAVRGRGRRAVPEAERHRLRARRFHPHHRHRSRSEAVSVRVRAQRAAVQSGPPGAPQGQISVRRPRLQRRRTHRRDRLGDRGSSGPVAPRVFGHALVPGRRRREVRGSGRVRRQPVLVLAVRRRLVST